MCSRFFGTSPLIFVLPAETYFSQDLEEQEKMTDEQLAIKNVGKQDPKRHLGETVNEMLADNIVQSLASMLDTSSFQ